MAVAGVSALVGAVTAACSVFVTTTELAAVAAAHSVDPDRWWTEFSAVLDRIGPRFHRYEPLRHAGELMAGMVSGLDRKNCWTIAEHRGDVTPDGLQHLLSRAKWDADGCVMICVTTSLTRLATRARYWFLMRQGMSRRACTRSVCSASTPARQAVSRTLRSRC